MNNLSNISLGKDGNINKKVQFLLNNDFKTEKINRVKSMNSIKLKRIFKRSNKRNEKKIKIKNFLTHDSLNHLQSMFKNNKLIPFEEYNKIIDKNMLDYKFVETDDKRIIKKNRKNYDANDYDQNNTNGEDEEVKNREISNNKHKLSRNISEPRYKITIKDYNFYKNPNDSLNTINNNNEIFNEINKDCLARQRILCINNIRNNSSFSYKFKFKMPKIKIFNSSSKIPSEIPVINLANNNDYFNNKRQSQTKDKHVEEELKLFAYYKYSSKNFPEGKEQFGLCTKGKNLFLTGGLSANMKQMNIWSLNMETLEWNKLMLKTSTYSRYGHTSVYFQNKIYFYGGTHKIEKSSIPASFELFSLTDKAFIQSNVKNSPSKRKNHIAEIIGNSMLIHGGIDEDNHVLDDCHLLNLQQMNWSAPMISLLNRWPKVFGHSSCLVVPSSILSSSAFNIYKFPDVDPLIKKTRKNIHRGLYIFGGKTKEINGITNNLWILLLGQQPLQWIKPETKGIPPSPRCFHSMNFYEKSRYIIIHGGRNDDLSSSCALNDTFILELTNLNWLKVHLYSTVNDFHVISRFGHNSSIFANKLIIFGGMNNNNYIGSSLFIINLDLNFPQLLKAAQLSANLSLEKDINSNEKDSKNIMQDLPKDLQKYELGIISNCSLPPIK